MYMILLFVLIHFYMRSGQVYGCSVQTGTPTDSGGSCSFNHYTTCGYTFNGYWKTHTGSYSYWRYTIPGHLTSGSKDAYYAVYDPKKRVNNDKTLISPRINPGHYCLSFWYYKTSGSSILSVSPQSIDGNTHTPIWSAKDAVSHKWTQSTSNFSQSKQFQIVFASDIPGIFDANTVAIDDVLLSPVAASTTSTTTPTPMKTLTTTPPPPTTTTTATRPKTTKTTTTTTSPMITTTTPTATRTTATRPTTTTTTLTTTTNTMKISTTTPMTSTKTLTAMRTTQPISTPTKTLTTILTTTSTPTTPGNEQKNIKPTVLETNITSQFKSSLLWRMTTTAGTKVIIGNLQYQSIHVGCDNNMWNISVEMTRMRQLYPHIKHSDIYLGITGCTGTEIGVLLVFQQNLQSCSSTEKKTNSSFNYRNKLIYAEHDPTYAFIIRRHVWDINVECDVPRDNVVHTHVHHDGLHLPDAVITPSPGHSMVSLAFFNDSSFQHFLPGPYLHVKVGDTVYVKVIAIKRDPDLKLILQSCYMKSQASAEKALQYYLIKNRCVTDPNTHIILYSQHEVRFVFQEIEYSTNYEGLEIYCQASLCDVTDYSSKCSPTCLPQQLIG